MLMRIHSVDVVLASQVVQHLLLDDFFVLVIRDDVVFELVLFEEHVPDIRGHYILLTVG